MAKLLTSFCQVALPVETSSKGNKARHALLFHWQFLHRPEERESTLAGKMSPSPQLFIRSQDSSGSIVTTGVRFPAGAKNSSLRHRIQTGFGAHPVSYRMGTGVKRAGREADHSPPF